MSTRTPIRVAFVDDNQMLSAMLERELNRSGDIKCIGRAGTAKEATSLVETEYPDILLIDIFLPGRDGIALAGDLMELHQDMRIIIYTNMAIESAEELQLMAESRRRADAWDFVSKNEDTDALLESIRSVAMGHRRTFLEDAVSAHTDPFEAPSRPRLRQPNLSSTEDYVLQMLGRGLTSEQIRETRADWAEKQYAVESHLRNLRNKFGVNNQVQLVLAAQRLGYLDPDDGEHS